MKLLVDVAYQADTLARAQLFAGEGVALGTLRGAEQQAQPGASLSKPCKWTSTDWLAALPPALTQCVHSFWPVREYPWGRCEALSSRHSDMPALKKLLFEVAYHDLKDATEKRYYVYREQQLLDMDDPSMCALPPLCIHAHVCVHTSMRVLVRCA